MAAYDLDEQEKLGDLKAWWSRYGNYVTGAITVIALAVAANQGWKYYTGKQAAEASGLYFALSDAASKNEMPKVKDAAAQLVEKFAGTGYAPRGALLAAKVAFDAGDLATAKTQLDWVVANSKEDELKSIARLRLAAVLLDQKQYDAALAALDGKHGESFAGLFLDMKGDIFNLQGKASDAKAAYEAALAKLDPKGSLKLYTQSKLDAVSAGVPAAAAAPAAPAATTGGTK
jgi:predicted negative regulator of RcsB-dependent stress response